MPFEISQLETETATGQQEGKFIRSVINIDFKTGVIESMGATSRITAGTRVTASVHNHINVSDNAREFLGDFAAMRATGLKVSFVLERGRNGQIAGVKMLSFDENDNPVLQNIDIATGDVIAGSKVVVSDEGYKAELATGADESRAAADKTGMFTRVHKVVGIEAPRAAEAVEDISTMLGAATALMNRLEALAGAAAALGDAGPPLMAAIDALRKAAEGLIVAVALLGENAVADNDAQVIMGYLSDASRIAGALEGLIKENKEATNAGRTEEMVEAMRRAICQAVGLIVKDTAIALSARGFSTSEHNRVQDMVDMARGLNDKLSNGAAITEEDMIKASLLADTARQLMQESVKRQEEVLEAAMRGAIDLGAAKGAATTRPGVSMPVMTATLQPETMAPGQNYPMLSAGQIAGRTAQAARGTAFKGEKVTDRTAPTKVVALDMSLPGAATVARFLQISGVRVVKIEAGDAAKPNAASDIMVKMQLLGQGTQASYFALLSERNRQLARDLQAYENVMAAVKSNNVTWQEALSCYVQYLDTAKKDSIAITKDGVQHLKKSSELESAKDQGATTEADKQFLSELESELAY
jgi:hypothetical protein